MSDCASTLYLRLPRITGMKPTLLPRHRRHLKYYNNFLIKRSKGAVNYYKKKSSWFKGKGRYSSFSINLLKKTRSVRIAFEAVAAVDIYTTGPFSLFFSFFSIETVTEHQHTSRSKDPHSTRRRFSRILTFSHTCHITVKCRPQYFLHQGLAIQTNHVLTHLRPRGLPHRPVKFC